MRSAEIRTREISWKRNLYAITLAQAIAIIAFSLREPILPFFLKELGADSTAAATRWNGLVASVGGFTMAITAPMWGIIGDRHGRKPMLLRSMIAASVTILLMGFATAPWHIVLLRLIEGAFTGTVTAATALVATSAPRDRLGYNLGMVQTAVFAGAAFGPALGGIAAGQIGYRPVFYLASVMMVLASLVVIFFVQEIFTKPAPGPRLTGSRRNNWSWMMTGMLLSMLTTLFAVRFVGQGIRPVMPLYLQDLGNFSNDRAAAVTGWMFAVLGVTSAISSIVLGRRGDRVGHRNILIACVFGAGLLYVPMAFATHPWQLIVLQGLFGVAAGGMIPAANTIIANATPPEHRGFTFGVTNTAGSVGSAFGPLILSSMIAPTLGFPAAFLTVGVLMTILAAWLWWNTGRRSQTAATPIALTTASPGSGAHP